MTLQSHLRTFIFDIAPLSRAMTNIPDKASKAIQL